MYCNKCGNYLEPGTRFCNKCGNQISVSQDNQNIVNSRYNMTPNYSSNNKSNNIMKLICIGLAVVLVFVVLFSVLKTKNNYYFEKEKQEKEEVTPENGDNNTKKGKYSTNIIYDNVYSGVSISNSNDAIELIVKDSVSQKDKCPSEIKQIEEDIINKYGVYAVNLCELDVDFAREIEKVFKKVYDEYPSVRGYLTNLTLVNGSFSNSYIAAFMPAFTFAISNSESTYPWVKKTQVVLNTSYFLNKDRLENTIKSAVEVNHFPKNSTIYSPVAHELGHFLSYLAMMKHYSMNSVLLINATNIDTYRLLAQDFSSGDFSLSMIEEAYKKYKQEKGTNLNIDDWRGQISKYALAKDNDGTYIYDETIAEAFHDVYLNGNNATDVSIYVVNVLKARLGS